MTDRAIHLGPLRLSHGLARGGMGEVWRGDHLATGVPIAVQAEAAGRSTFVARIHTGLLAGRADDPVAFAAALQIAATKAADGGRAADAIAALQTALLHVGTDTAPGAAIAERIAALRAKTDPSTDA